MTGEMWVFGYGSLMWRPGFEFVEKAPARIGGYHRAFCISSVHHRGTATRPGLVLGLDRGRSCLGLAYRVAAARKGVVLDYLRRRELVNGVYREVHLPATLLDGSHRQVFALAYIAERYHPSYVGSLPLVTQAHQIRGARGISGSNLDYLISTVLDLRTRGIRECELERVMALAAPHASRMLRADLTSPVSDGVRRVVCRRGDDAKRMRPPERRRFLYRLKVSGNDAMRPAETTEPSARWAKT